jgi:hypothetical protein
MRAASIFALPLLLSVAAFGQSSPSIVPQIVDIPSGNLRLKGYFWQPAGSGPFPAEGHNFLYLGGPQWEPDAFKFLDDHVKR